MKGQIIANDDSKPPIDINCKDMMILVVDDDHTSLSVIGGILKSWKYNVETVRSGGEALSILRSKQDKRFDLVVTDIHMPDMNGFELLRRISIDFQVPIVMMSSDDSEKIMTKGLECGASYFMRKPVCPKDLQNLWLYVIPKKNQDSSPGQMIIADTNNTPKSHGNSTIQQVAGSSAHSAQIMSQGPWPITQYMQQRKVALVEKHQEENRRRRKTRNLNQTPKVTATIPPLNYPASVFANRKPKVAWFTGLHNKFLDALKIIGLGRAVPKKILEVMNVPGLTRENVASHLQKYRIFLKKIADVAERGDGISKPSKSKFALSYFPMPFGLDLENLDDADDNLLRKKLKQELRAIRDPLYMGPSWRQYGTILPNNNAGNTSAPFTSNYPVFPLEPNKQMSVAGLVELGGTGSTNEGQAAPERNNYEITRENIRGNNSNANSQMITGQQPSAFVPYGMNMNSNSSEAHTGGLVNNYVPQITNNLGNGYGVESQNSGMVMSQGILCNAIMQNTPRQPLKLLNANSESGNGYVYDMSHNSDISGFQADFSEHLIQQLGGGDHKSNSLEQARNPFLAFSDNISGQVQLQNKIQESEPIPNQQDSSYFGEDFNPWFDQEPIQTQAGNQTANMLITDELLAMCQGFRGEALSSLQNGSPKKSDTP